MGRVISSNYDDYTMHSMTHGHMSERTLESLRARAATAGGMMSGRLRELHEESIKSLERLDLDLVRDRVRLTEERSNRRFDEDILLPLIELDDFRQAKQRNRDTLMYHPRARKLYYEGRTAGFHGDFTDNEPGQVGKQHTQWRELMSGSYHEDGEDSGFTTYLDGEPIKSEVDVDPYTYNDKLIIRDNHERLDRMFDAGEEDPLDQLGGSL